MSKTGSLVNHTIAVLLLCGATGTLQAGLIQFPMPTTTYTSGTTLLPLGPQDSPVSSLTNGIFTVGISGATAIPRAAVPVGWQTWGSPPDTESSVPPVLEFQTPLTCFTCTITLSFSSAIRTFGFEAEPDPFVIAHNLTVMFFDGATSVGSITRSYPTGLGTAKLIAATTPDQHFTSVTITADTDFAIAQVRYSTDFVGIASVPEPGGIAVAGLGLLAIAALKRRSSTHRES